jgi:hypothetical protein
MRMYRKISLNKYSLLKLFELNVLLYLFERYGKTGKTTLNILLEEDLDKKPTINIVVPYGLTIEYTKKIIQSVSDKIKLKTTTELSKEYEEWVLKKENKKCQINLI